jgi:hypothetical protein
MSLSRFRGGKFLICPVRVPFVPIGRCLLAGLHVVLNINDLPVLNAHDVPTGGEPAPCPVRVPNRDVRVPGRQNGTSAFCPVCGGLKPGIIHLRQGTSNRRPTHGAIARFGGGRPRGNESAGKGGPVHGGQTAPRTTSCYRYSHWRQSRHVWHRLIENMPNRRRNRYPSSR